LTEFIKKIFKKWFGIFSLIASFSGLFLFYTGIDTNYIVINLLNSNWLTISLIFLLISSYQVWLDVKKEKITLENKLKNPIDYEIKAYKQNIHIDLDYLESLYDENIKESIEILTDVNSEIQSLSISDNLKTTNMSKMLLMRYRESSFHNNLKSDELYIQELRNYIIELENYPKMKENFLTSWKLFINNDLENIYYIIFSIKNIGTIADEDIDIEITHQDKYIIDVRLLENFPKKPFLPKKEVVSISQQSPNYSFDSVKIDKLRRDTDPLTYKRYEEINDTTFSVKIRDLKVSKEINIFRQNGFFMHIIHEDDFNVNILSKKSNSAIQKKIIFEKNGSYDYVKKQMI
jgi:hypothetical protein